VVAAAIGTRTAFVEWAALTRLVNSGVIEACGFFLGVPDFRAAALGVCKQVCGCVWGGEWHACVNVLPHSRAVAVVAAALCTLLLRRQ
jgi:hypothetical protein